MADPFQTYGSQESKPDEGQPNRRDSEDSFASYGEWARPEPTTEVPSINQAADREGQTEVEGSSQSDSAASEAGTFQELLDELDRLTGLHRVKSEINQLMQFVKVQELRRLEGIASTKPALHSVFYGSPGTGKTTVARLYGKMLQAMGLLSKGHLVETDRSGLVGGFIGQTPIKTDAKVQEALGGVLFIDEAYALSRGEHAQWDYGAEAIEILLKRMEDHRDDFVVIVAGYPEPMEEFLTSNEGLRSRFSTYVHFDDYRPEELLEIFTKLCENENYKLAEDALGLVSAAISNSYSLRDKTFGNARYVRNLFETIIKNQAFRVGATIQNPSHQELCVILPEDVPFLTPSDNRPFTASTSH